ncbi:hypothetical protein [Halomicrobium urmianum]|uniref:hypothetical protein n=1 Tax=Halomicrobium urmianum TaxID=1586233 RepID=UPI001CD949F3|nr:hypothetical protein [Halomicrobium urmianum]
MGRALTIGGSTVVGLAVGVGTYLWLVPDPLLAGGLALTYGLGVGLYVQWGQYLRAGSNQWRTNRWRMAFTAYAATMALLAIGPTLGVDLNTQIAVQLLVLGTAWVGMLFGVASVGDLPADERPQGAEADADAAD